MNNKIIIAIVSSLIVVCLAVGIGMNHKSGNSKDETNSTYNTKKVSAVDEISAQNENSETESASSTEKAEIKSTSFAEKSSSAEEKEEPKAQEKASSTTKKQPFSEKTTKKHTTEKVTEQKNLLVTFSVNCEKAVDYGADYPRYIINKTNCTAPKGTTVFDLLNAECRKHSVALVHQNKSYVKAIGGLSEKDCGNGSGWTYLVNGVKPMMSASKYVLKDGDVVEWYYVTSPTD